MSDPTGMADEVRCGDASEGAALGLLGLMTGMSEEFWCAGWMSGMEYSLWRVEPDMQWGQGTVSGRQADLLRLLHEECDGWWAWTGDGPDAGPRFFRTAEWLERLSALSL